MGRHRAIQYLFPGGKQFLGAVSKLEAGRVRLLITPIGLKGKNSLYLMLSVSLVKERNPFQPLRYFNLGHVEILIWEPPRKPECFSMHTQTQWHYLLSAFIEQKARVIRKNTFASSPSYWQLWPVSRKQYSSIKDYLHQLHSNAKSGALKYEVAHFNCFHVALHCLEMADVTCPEIPLQRVAVVRTITPKNFLNSIMPNARFSVMRHELDVSNAIGMIPETIS